MGLGTYFEVLPALIGIGKLLEVLGGCQAQGICRLVDGQHLENKHLLITMACQSFPLRPPPLPGRDFSPHHFLPLCYSS